MTDWAALCDATDPFADEGDPLDSHKEVGSQQDYIHIRIQQRNGRKTLTTLQGLPKSEHYPLPLISRLLKLILPRAEYDSKKLLKAFKKVRAAHRRCRCRFDHHRLSLRASKFGLSPMLTVC